MYNSILYKFYCFRLSLNMNIIKKKIKNDIF